MIRTVLAIIGIVALAIWLLGASPAECTYCGNAFCLDTSGCFEGCACAIDYGDASGHCVSVR